jgi:hypothetical protein
LLYNMTFDGQGRPPGATHQDAAQPVSDREDRQSPPKRPPTTVDATPQPPPAVSITPPAAPDGTGLRVAVALIVLLALLLFALTR